MKCLFFQMMSCFWVLSMAALAREPVATRENFLEKRFGRVILDPYKWMENEHDPRLKIWIQEQENYLKQNLPSENYADVLKRIQELRTKSFETKVSKKWAPQPAPSPDYSVMDWSQESVTAKTANVAAKGAPKYEMTVRSIYGGDLSQVIVRNLEKNVISDTLLVKLFDYRWDDQGEGFFYLSDHDHRNSGDRMQLKYHKLGTPQFEDKVLFDSPTRQAALELHHLNGRFFLVVYHNKLGAIDFARKLDYVVEINLQTGNLSSPWYLQGVLQQIYEDGGQPKALITSLAFTDKGEIISLNLETGKKELLLEAQTQVITKARYHTQLGILYFLTLNQLCSSELGSYHLQERRYSKLNLTYGTLDFTPSALKEEGIEVSYQSFRHPHTKLQLQGQALTVEESELTKTFIPIEEKNIFYTATTGHQGAIRLYFKKGLELSENTPLIAHAYGGFRVSFTPFYNFYDMFSWIESGGVFALVDLPGSNTLGEAWYKAAIRENRDQAWQSLVKALEHLHSLSLSSPARTAILGASYGGTIVLSILQNRPDIAKAFLSLVPVTDFLNFSQYTAGKYWFEEFGDPTSAQEFPWVLKGSLYHTLKPTQYPATLIQGAEYDDRVVPMHSYKYVAKIQKLNQGESPLLFSLKRWGAHGRGSGPHRESLRQLAEIQGFVRQIMNLE
jgi:prolyl oligopeptidase